MTKTQIINTIYDILQSGKIVEIDGKNMNGTICKQQQYLYWEHFGSSAEKCNKKNLIWIINTIFECKNKKPTYKIVEHI